MPESFPNDSKIELSEPPTARVKDRGRRPSNTEVEVTDSNASRFRNRGRARRTTRGRHIGSSAQAPRSDKGITKGPRHKTKSPRGSVRSLLKLEPLIGTTYNGEASTTRVVKRLALSTMPVLPPSEPEPSTFTDPSTTASAAGLQCDPAAYSELIQDIMETEPTEWQPARLLHIDSFRSSHQFALLVLNQPIKNFLMLKWVWEKGEPCHVMI
jgi:hypothetical protein